MIDFREVDRKIELLPESAFFLVFCSEAVFLLLSGDEIKSKFSAAECLRRGMDHLQKIARPGDRTHSFFDVYKKLEDGILSSKQIDPDFLQLFLQEAHDLAEMIEI